MIYCLDLGLSYQPVPKVACTSIKTALLRGSGLPVNGEVHRVASSVHDSILHNQVFTLGKTDRACFSFAFVRNPYDRLVSCYLNKVVQADTGLEEHFRETDFPSFVRHIVATAPDTANLHFRPQSRILAGHRLDFVGRFETLSQDWAHICRASAQSIALPHCKSSTNDGNYQRWYDDETRAIATAYYAQDLEHYGYLF